MRIMRKTLDTKVVAALSHISRRWYMDDPGFAEDLFVLVRQLGAGIPMPERCDVIAEITARLSGTNVHLIRPLVRRRAFTFKELCGTAYFKAVVGTMQKAPLDAVDRLLSQIRQFGRKQRQAQCQSCSLLVSCKFGSLYAKSTQDITKVAITDVQATVNPKCPHIDDFNENSDALKMAQFLNGAASFDADTITNMLKNEVARYTSATPDSWASSAEEVNQNAPDGTNDPDGETDPDNDEDFHITFITGVSKGGAEYGGVLRSNLVLNDALLSRVTAQQLALFEIGHVLDGLLGKQGVDNYKPTDEIGKSKDRTTIESVSEIVQADATELAQDNDLLLRKAVKGELTKQEELNPQRKKHLLYVLVDNSASMSCQTGSTNILGAVSRIDFSAILLAAFAKKVQAEEGMMFVRLFGTGVSTLIQAKDDEGFKHLHQRAAHFDANGGGTDILLALRTAFSDIQTAKDEVSKAEVLLITDACDKMQRNKLLEAKGKVKLHTLDVSGQPIEYSAGKVLSSVSERYFRLDPASPDLSGLIKTLATSDGDKQVQE